MGGITPGGHVSASAEQLVENRVDVDGVVERLAHARILQRAARRVERDVPEAQRGRGGEERLLFVGLLPARGVGLGDVQEIDVPALEFGDGCAMAPE